MRIVDLNVLIYATDQTSVRHDVSREWLDRALSSSETVGVPTAVAVGYIRLCTNPRVMESPLDVATCVGVVQGWYARSNVAAPQPTQRHFAVLSELLEPVGAGGNLVSDAHLAALAIEHGAELYSFDRDFSGFSGLRWLEPTLE